MHKQKTMEELKQILKFERQQQKAAEAGEAHTKYLMSRPHPAAEGRAATKIQSAFRAQQAAKKATQRMKREEAAKKGDRPRTVHVTRVEPPPPAPDAKGLAEAAANVRKSMAALTTATAGAARAGVEGIQQRAVEARAAVKEHISAVQKKATTATARVLNSAADVVQKRAAAIEPAARHGAPSGSPEHGGGWGPKTAAAYSS